MRDFNEKKSFFDDDLRAREQEREQERDKEKRNQKIQAAIIDQSQDIDSFHICLFNFPFIYQFYSIITTLVKSTC